MILLCRLYFIFLMRKYIFSDFNFTLYQMRSLHFDFMVPSLIPSKLLRSKESFCLTINPVSCHFVRIIPTYLVHLNDLWFYKVWSNRASKLRPNKPFFLNLVCIKNYWPLTFIEVGRYWIWIKITSFWFLISLFICSHWTIGRIEQNSWSLTLLVCCTVFLFTFTSNDWQH